jgi:hypothetical protein
MNYPAAEQRGIDRNIHNSPKGGEFMRLGRIKHLPTSWELKNVDNTQ